MPRLKARLIIAALAAALAAALCSCSPTKHVPAGRLLLDKAAIVADNDSVSTTELRNYLRQTPNHVVLGFAKLQLGVYNLSGRDSTKWHNRWLQRLGEPPAIYDPELTEVSRRQLQQTLVNRGYINAQVEAITSPQPEKKRISVEYRIKAGEPYRIASMAFSLPDSALAHVVYADTASLRIATGQKLDRDKLDELRAQLATRLHDAGYYAFNKDDITFLADTVAGSHDVALTLCVHNPGARRGAAPASADRHLPYRIRDVVFVTDFDQAESISGNLRLRQDTVGYKGITVLYGPDRYINPKILDEKCLLRPGRLYSDAAVDRTYQMLGQLGILRYINIEMKPVAVNASDDLPEAALDTCRWIDAYVLLSRNKKQSVSVEVEGTNSEGDLGFGIGVTYQHRNLGHRSNLLTLKGRAAYESLSRHFDGFINDRYSEYAGEASITFPKFQFPFVSSAYKRRHIASSELALSFNYQERPEYTRVIGGAAWRYKWRHRHGASLTQQTFDMVDVNYVSLPKSTLNFLDSVAPANPLLRYSYEDHFIMRMGYSFYRSNKRMPTLELSSFAVQPYVSTFRGSAEIAGNALYAISSIVGQHRHDGAYKIFGIQYAQYVKAEADYTYTRNINSRNAVAFHIGGGVAVPYLNSRMVPFEKRFYAGGANSVRGWSVRTLGPGCYDSRSSVTDFINQCGDILLNMNVEYRAKLFWVVEGALFIDAGNIWTIRSYENQPGGVFKLDSFYKQIAAAYGLGVRFDFTYFLLRFDLGFKAHNPAKGQEPWPLLHPRWSRDAAFHFAVGYPF